MSTLLEHDRFFVSQKTKLIELTNEYKIFDEQGTEIGMVRQEGQSSVRKALRFVSSVDQFLTTKLAVYDINQQKVAELTRPAKFLKSKVLVADGTGRQVGQIVQKNAIGKINFAIEGAQGEAIGEIQGQNWRAWNFSIVDQAGQEVGIITKKWEGILRTAFTTADRYLVEIKPEITGDHRLLLVSSALCIDTALKQDARGLG
jgi:uncharacterized protein YxjI